MPVEDLEKLYKPENHPRVKTRDKLCENVFNEFSQGIRARAKDGHVDLESFMEFYADLHATLPAGNADYESYFINLVLNSWGVSEDQGSGAIITQDRLEELENVIFEKVRQRTHGAEDEGRTVRKTFRHFDLNDSGTICLAEFLQVLEAYGCVFGHDEIRALFNKYDKDRSGKLDYEEFSNFFALKGSGNNPNVNPVFAVEREKPDQIMDKIREKLIERGTHGIRGIGILFRRMDDSGDRKLDRMEF